jgi:hypothetical protein
MLPRFVADAMLGRLAKWLRILGYDTLYDPAWADPHLVRLARAEERLLLTRDRELARRRGVRVLFVESEALPEQLAQLRQACGVTAAAPFTRCPRCNALLQPVAKEQLWDEVHSYTYATQDEFRRCPQCQRPYWRGSHHAKMEELLRAALPEPGAGDRGSGNRG